jgi:hypothetical protein
MVLLSYVIIVQLWGTIYFWMHAIKIQLASGIKDGTAGSGAYAYLK